jgi:colicin import membrane protein
VNTTNKTEMTEVAVAAQSAIDAMAVVTLSPEKYAAEVYQPFNDQLTTAIDSLRNVEYDIQTTAGMAIAVKCRALPRDIRVAADKERKARKAPLNQIGKLLESGFDQIEARTTPLEELFDADIKAEEARKEADRAAKIAAERARRDHIEDMVAAIRECATDAVNLCKTAFDVQKMHDHLAPREITAAEFQEYFDEAVKAKTDALGIIARTLVTRTEQEAEAARLKAEREELARLRAEQVERERIAKAESDRAAAAAQAELQAAQDKFNAEQAEARRLQRIEDDRRAGEIAAERAELKRQQEELTKAQEAESERVRLQALADQHLADHAEALAMNATWVKAVAVDATPLEFVDPADTIIGQAVIPTHEEIIQVVADHFGVEVRIAYGWLLEMQQDIEYA